MSLDGSCMLRGLHVWDQKWDLWWVLPSDLCRLKPCRHHHNACLQLLSGLTMAKMSAHLS